MSEISDQLRARGDGYFEQRNGDCEWFCAIADRIEEELVELPKGMDGVPIHVGDTVWDMRDLQRLSVIDIVMSAHDVRLYVTSDGTVKWYVNPTDLTHTRPDSLERIAEELEAWCNSVDVNGDTCKKPRDIVKRIRKLAKKEDRQCQ